METRCGRQLSLAKIRSVWLVLTAPVVWVSCFLNPGPDLPDSPGDDSTPRGGAGGAAQGGSGGTAGTATGGSATGGSATGGSGGAMGGRAGSSSSTAATGGLGPNEIPIGSRCSQDRTACMTGLTCRTDFAGERSLCTVECGGSVGCPGNTVCRRTRRNASKCSFASTVLRSRCSTRPGSCRTSSS